MIRNPYRVLGVSPKCSKEEIKLTYKRLAKRYHPDSLSGDTEKFLRVREAWELIKSKEDKVPSHKISRLTHKTLFTFERL